MGIPLKPTTIWIQAVHIILLKWPYFSISAEKTSGKMQLKNPKKSFSHAFRKRNKFSLNYGSSIFWWVFSLLLIYIALLICRIPRILYSLKFWRLYIILMISNNVLLFKCIIPYFISERLDKGLRQLQWPKLNQLIGNLYATDNSSNN